MNKTSLSLAIFMALGVVACGGSGNGDDNQVVPDNTPAPTPETTPSEDNATTHDSTLVDPTQTHVVDDKNLLEETTVGSLQYIRRDGSDYDRNYNPEQRASSTPLLGVPLDVQNPKLTNIVLARQELIREDGKPVKAQFAGGLSPEPLTREGRPQGHESLQVENYQNVDILAGAFKQFGSAKTHTDGSQIPNTSVPNNNLGDKYDYDTHVADNVRPDREFNRERVSHVYTLRYEYLQPYVDYPYIQNPTDANHRANSSGAYPNRQYQDNLYVQPQPARQPTAHDLLNAAGHISTYFPDNYFSWDNARKGSHNPNNGLGVHDTLVGPVSGDTLSNSLNLYGNLTPTGGAFPANAWKNQNSDTDPLAVGKNWVAGTATTPGHYTRGDTGNAAKNYTDQATLDWTRASLMPRYPNGGYPKWSARLPRYPNEPYDHPGLHGGTGGTADNKGSPFYTNPYYTHEHTYLEEDEFTAIREGKPVRPLRNPKANTWEWESVSDWRTTYNWTGTATFSVPDPNDPTATVQVSGAISGNRSETDTGIQNHTLTAITSRVGNTLTPTGTFTVAYNDPVSGASGSQTVTCGQGGVTCTGTYGDITAATITKFDWVNGTNKKDGIQGEFRGPNYVGYNEGERTIRFSDERIWKPGTDGYKPEYERIYGANLIWWSTQDSAFENWATRFGWDPRARRVDNNINDDPQDLERLLADARDEALEIQPTGDITNGLIRISTNKGSYPTLGEELKWDDTAKVWKDHHNTTTRVFGRYHLAWSDGGDIKPVTMNSYQGARSFVARVADVELNKKVNFGNGESSHRFSHRAKLDSAPTHYSIGAIPMTLQKVQYGRVTTNLDIDIGEGPYEDGFLMAPFRYKNDGSAVDNYFYRGIEATTIDQMKAVTANNGMARYEGHALMYGIDNDFKNITKVGDPSQKSNLPNAFSIPGTPDANIGDAALGLGNFVQAEVNFGTKKVSGEVYNAWLEKVLHADNPGGKVTKDLLVHFQGDIMGNTVIGTADRTYVTGDDKADFRASFFGEHADEMGGSFNSVKREQKYGSAYEAGDWGGVFGAKKVGSGNTFQGDDGANVYNGL